MSAPAHGIRWNLQSVYSGFATSDFEQDREQLERELEALRAVVSDSAERDRDPRSWLLRSIERLNRVLDLQENLEAYVYSSYSVETTNESILAELNRIEELSVPLKGIRATFRNNVGALESLLPGLLDGDEELSEYRFFLEEELFYSKHQMGPELEELSGELNLSGGEAWSRLQETLSSTHTELWDDGEPKTIVALRALAFNPDRSVRQKAYRLELEAWKKLEIPLAYSLNGVKGGALTLQKRRRFEDSLTEAIHQSRITRPALDSLTESMTEALPDFRRYMKAKARLLGLDTLAFYDIFAPIGGETTVWRFDEARAFVVEQFSRFSTELSHFAERAFAGAWIDAEPRPGKVGGAYCISFPMAEESRILANFDGSFAAVSTIAHELGHAYHHEVLKKHSAIHRAYPMTLAETASIFCETIIYNAALEQASGSERLIILETLLQDVTQVIVDILSRFIFESRLFEQRRNGELSPRRLCELMLEAQEATYGDALNRDERHPYMWAVKGHYYRPELGFYNFPYAFGQLFGLGLYAQYGKDPKGFPARYKSLLEGTGRKSAVELTRDAGFDIEAPGFWQTGLATVRGFIDEFVELAEGDTV